jgi:uncharacterized membrane protein YphA (DoxX/SURF4 family)
LASAASSAPCSSPGSRCSGAAFIALGLVTRLHALGLAFTMFIAWLLWRKRRFTGPNAGETAFAHMFGYLLLLFFAGAGRYSLDRLLGI